MMPPAAPILRAGTETTGFVLVRFAACYYIVNSTSRRKITYQLDTIEYLFVFFQLDMFRA